ncbi:MAG: DegT/DnrJ/EryC1/StrS family aminotransferase, partial [bacterium]
SDFFEGKVNKYEWVDIGSSFLLSDINAAVLLSQIENMDAIQKRRIAIWNKYYQEFEILWKKGFITLPIIPKYGEVNGHLFFLECESLKIRDSLIRYLRKYNIHAVFHYLPLHLSPFFKNKHDGRILNNAVRFSERLIRLPLFFELAESEQDYIIKKVKEFF